LNAFQHLVHLSPLEIVIHQFESFQSSWRGKKSFTEVLLQHPHEIVQVMSIHKSKGQEFDVVFMPFLQADQFPHETGQIRFDEADRLLQELERIAARESGNTLPESYQEDKKREKIEEEARLIYVGLTRAKRALHLSAHKQALTKYNKLRTVAPAAAFELLAAKLAPETEKTIPLPHNVIALPEVRNAQPS
jgi:exodeoxyribonuclease V beta subunit